VLRKALVEAVKSTTRPRALTGYNIGPDGLKHWTIAALADFCFS